MAIIIEDATGLATAESYLSVVSYTDYWTARGVTVTETEALIEANLRLSTEYIDIRWGSLAPGNKISEDQALAFPTDYFIVDPVALPIQLKRACAEYTRWAISSELFIDNDLTNGPGITRLKEKLGPLETDTEWSGSGNGSVSRKYPIITKADSLMRQITLANNGSVYR